MNRPLVPLFAISAAIVLVAGCDPETQHRPPEHRPGGFTGPHSTVPPDDGSSEPVANEGPHDTHETERPTKHDETESPREPAHNTPPPAVGNYEYGKAVPGKPGFVTSPYAPYQGYVDVRGYAPGTEVKDPYTGKTFLVPAQ